MDDRQLIARCRANDPGSFGDLIRRHAPDLLAFLQARPEACARADEIAREAYTRAWLRLGSLRDPSSFGAWVKGIALRVARESSRAAARTAPPDPLAAARALDDPASGDPALDRAVAALPPRERDAVLLRYYAGLTCDQIARHEGEPIGTVTKRLSRAHARLRELLASDARPVPAPQASEVSP